MLMSAVVRLMLTKNPSRAKALGFAACMTIFEMLSQGACSVNTCHCQQQETTTSCPKNGYCVNGCDKGFYGPGCQLSNVAYRKEARQSSTFTVVTGRNYGASLAVDGYYVNDFSVDWAPNCSHTASSNTSNWWQVVLGVTKKYTILNITIINRMDSSAGRLRDFKIYVSDHGEIYPKGNWTFCAEQQNEAPFITNFTCTQTLTGRSVAIVQNNTNSPYLALCEVIIGGYEYKECSEGFTGPGCLLRSCDSQECIKGGSCGPLRSCKFQQCPRNEYLPPDCWITLPNFASYTWKTQVDAVKIAITGTPTEPTNFEATAMEVKVSVRGVQIDSSTLQHDLSSSGSVNVSIEGEPGTTYSFKIIPRHCFKDKVCPDGSHCFEAPVCLEGVSLDWIKVKTNGRTDAEDAYSIDTCHCRQQNTCRRNGYCVTGCATGFYGPGCLRSNLAYRKEARQSTTYVSGRNVRYEASLAVDGYYSTDPAQEYAPNCSHTSPTTSRTWWQVTLGVDKKYVISRITIINRPDFHARRLRDFKIFSSSSRQIYPEGHWTFCANFDEAVPFIANYTCSQPNVGQSVAIVQDNKYSFQLTLCEVIIDGYEFSECNEGFTGPGCLLRSCDSAECIIGGSCGPLHSCEFQQCPGNNYLPPDCWMTLSNFSSYIWSTKIYGDAINIIGKPTELADFEANAIALNVLAAGVRVNYSSRTKYNWTSRGSLSVLVKGEPETNYSFKVIPIHCFKERVCPDGVYCFAESSCLEGKSSDWIKVEAFGRELIYPEDSRAEPSHVGELHVLLLFVAFASAISQ